jgi:hypothetical protein
MKNNLLKRFGVIIKSGMMMAGLMALAVITTASGNSQTNEVAANPDTGEFTIQQPVLQEIQQQKYERTFKTIINDPEDGIEKKVELRYNKEGNLTEVLVDGRLIPQADHSKYQKIIDEVTAEEKRLKEEMERVRIELDKVMKDISNIDFKAIRAEIDLNMEEVRRSVEESRREIEKIDRDAIRRDMERVRTEIDRVRTEVIIPELEHRRILSEEEKEEIRKSLETAKKEIQRNMEELHLNMQDLHISIDKGMTRVIINNDQGSTVSPQKKQKMQKQLEELEARKK